jgi:hypothetical protein
MVEVDGVGDPSERAVGVAANPLGREVQETPSSAGCGVVLVGEYQAEAIWIVQQVQPLVHFLQHVREREQVRRECVVSVPLPVGFEVDSAEHEHRAGAFEDLRHELAGLHPDTDRDVRPVALAVEHLDGVELGCRVEAVDLLGEHAPDPVESRFDRTDCRGVGDQRAEEVVRAISRRFVDGDLSHTTTVLMYWR